MKILSDNQELKEIADKYIPGVYSSCRSYWLKGYIGLNVKTIKSSETDRFYKMGKKQAKINNFFLQSLLR